MMRVYLLVFLYHLLLFCIFSVLRSTAGNKLNSYLSLSLCFLPIEATVIVLLWKRKVKFCS